MGYSTGQQNAVSSVANVSTAADFYNAVMNPKVTRINVTKDLNFWEKFTDSSNIVHQMYNTNTIMTQYVPAGRDLTVNGQGHNVDFAGYSFYMGTPDKTLSIQDITMYGTNYYGPLSMLGSSSNYKTAVNYNNVTYIGNQLTYSPYAGITFSGVNNVQSGQNYYPPVTDPSNKNTPNYVTMSQFATDYDSKNQYYRGSISSNVYARRVEFTKGSSYTGTTYNGSNFAIGGWGQYKPLDDNTPETQNSNSFIVGEDATVNLTPRGSSGSLYTPTGHGYGIYMMSAYGGIILNKNGQLNITPDINPNSYSQYSGLGVYSYGQNGIQVKDDAKFNVQITQPLQDWSNVVNLTNAYSTINTGQNSVFNISAINQPTTSKSTAYRNLLNTGTVLPRKYANYQKDFTPVTLGRDTSFNLSADGNAPVSLIQNGDPYTNTYSYGPGSNAYQNNQYIRDYYAPYIKADSLTKNNVTLDLSQNTANTGYYYSTIFSRNGSAGFYYPVNIEAKDTNITTDPSEKK
ncbi:pectate lyase-like adhesive domain-containing protein [Holzapfeliella floricola]|uniref:pectate lyase-like adhesive domain-containing protein n=1 Tax=Holzapfeliella floricola TaxID=679249 RepID=UPI001A937AB4|nr:pectate lyase-like adhesive domain-containing protein [Holzapfeliella floricola]